MKLAIILALCLPAFAQVTTRTRDPQGNPEITIKAVMPTTPTSLTTDKLRLKGILVVNNNAGSAVTITITDNSTDCASAACPLVPTAVSIPALTEVWFPLWDMPADGGITWSASASNVVARVKATPTP